MAAWLPVRLPLRRLLILLLTLVILTHLPIASGMTPSYTIIVCLIYLFILFLVLGVSSFGKVCSAVDSFE
jgi:hypothetical protein